MAAAEAAAAEVAKDKEPKDVPLVKALAVEKARRKQLEKALEAVQEELRDAQKTIAAQKRELATAETATARALRATKAIRENARVLDELEGTQAGVDWPSCLTEYLARHQQ